MTFIMNRINGAETEADCVLAILSSPKQEVFIKRCKAVLNAKIWLGIGKGWIRSERERVEGTYGRFIEKKILKWRLKKKKKKKDI